MAGPCWKPWAKRVDLIPQKVDAFLVSDTDVETSPKNSLINQLVVLNIGYTII